MPALNMLSSKKQSIHLIQRSDNTEKHVKNICNKNAVIYENNFSLWYLELKGIFCVKYNTAAINTSPNWTATVKSCIRLLMGNGIL